MYLPEAMWTEILARLPLTSIAVCKSVCREWKTLTETSRFHDLFVSINHDSTSSWSFMRPDQRSLTQVSSLHGCQRWGLNKPLSSYISSFDVKNPTITIKASGLLAACVDGLVLMYVLPVEEKHPMYYVGYPVLRHWVQVPHPPPHHMGTNEKFGLVTSMDGDVLLGYKVVQVLERLVGADASLKFQIYSSETGEWICKELFNIRPSAWRLGTRPLCLNGNLHWMYYELFSLGKGLVVHEFYGGADTEEDDKFRFIDFPKAKQQGLGGNNRNVPMFPEKVCSTSGGFLVFMEKSFRNGHETLTVWRLKSYTGDSGEWQLSWQVKMSCIGPGVGYVGYAPVGMHPFDTETVYLWSYVKRCMVSGNLRTRKFKFHEESSSSDGHGLIQSFSDCTEYVRSYHSNESLIQVQCFTQFVPPRWLEPVPRNAASTSPYLPHKVLPKHKLWCCPFAGSVVRLTGEIERSIRRTCRRLPRVLGNCFLQEL